MASVIKAGNATTGVQVTADATGILEIKTGTGSGTTAITVGTDQAVTFAAGTTVSSLTTSGAVSAGSLTVNSNNISAVNSLGFRNRIINGDMRIDQRNNGASVTASTTGTAVYTLDRWSYFVNQASKFTVQRSTTAPAGFTNSLLITSSSAYSVGSGDYLLLRGAIEGFNIADLGWGASGAQSVVLSFVVRSSLTGQFGGALRNGAGNYSYPFSYTINSANTFETKTIIITGPTAGTWLTDNSLGIEIDFSMGSGSTYTGTAGSWSAATLVNSTGSTNLVGTNGATFYITGVQLEAGSVATPFERRDYGRELMMCQRYFTVLGSGANLSIGAGCNYNTTTAYGNLSLPVTMRTTPTIYQTTGTDYYSFYRNGAADNCNSVTLGQVTERAIEFYNNSEISGTAGHGGLWRTNNSAAYFAVQAEL